MNERRRRVGENDPRTAGEPEGSTEPTRPSQRSPAGRPGAVRRLVVALLAIATVVVSLSGDREATAEAGSTTLPEGIWVPDAQDLIPLDGKLAVDGNEVESLLFRTRATPEEIVTHLRGTWEDRPVDLIEDHRDGASTLTVLDIHGGRRWTVSARETQGGLTEVIRGITTMGADSVPLALPFDPPPSLRTITSLQDRLGGEVVSTWVVAAEEEADIQASIRLAGWAPSARAGDTRTLGDERGLPAHATFTREGQTLSFAWGGTFDDQGLATIRLEETR